MIPSLVDLDLLDDPRALLRPWLRFLAERVPFRLLYRTARLRTAASAVFLGMMLAGLRMATAMVGTLGYYAPPSTTSAGDVEMGAREHLDRHLGMVFGLAGIPSVAGSPGAGKRNALLVIGARHRRLHRRLVLTTPTSRGCSSLRAAAWPSQVRASGPSTADAGRRDRESDELDTGLRREGNCSRIARPGSQAGLALGNLGSAGYSSPASTPTCPPRAMSHLPDARFLSGIPAVGLLLAIIVTAGFGLTEKRMYEIRNELEARRARAVSAARRAVLLISGAEWCITQQMSGLVVLQLQCRAARPQAAASH